VMYGSLRWRVTGALAALMLLLASLTALIPIAVQHSADLFALIGRDQSFTGRTPLWDAVVIAISKKPYLGYGFSSFWLGDSGPSASVVDMVGWIPPHAHNGFLDIWLDMGLVGVLIFASGFVVRFRTAVLDYRRVPDRTVMWPLVLMTFVLFYNFTESTLIRPNSIYWALYVGSMIKDVR
jgi:exopolysaccharide production protein ExoQ